MPIKVTQPKPTGVPGIIQDGPERFIARARWTDSKGRRRKREAVAATLAEAVVIKEKLMGADLPMERPIRQRFADYAEQWIEVHGDLLADSTRDRYIGSLAHATVAFGQCFVDTLRTADVRKWHLQAAKKGSRATANGWLRVLRVALDEAVEDGILEFNPARVVKALPEGRTRGKRGTALDRNEFVIFLSTTQRLAENSSKLRGKRVGKHDVVSKEEVIAPDVARMLQLLAWTGMRRGELLALRWTDYVDGELRIERSVWNGHEKTTKTDDPRRITVVEPLAEVLTEQRQWLVREQHAGLTSGLMFPASAHQARAGAKRRGSDEVCWFRSGSVLNAPLRKIVAASGIPPISVHSLRRTWENLLRKAGVESLVRRSMAGWRTEEAQAIYASVDRSERDAAGAAVVRMVMGGDS